MTAGVSGTISLVGCAVGSSQVRLASPACPSDGLLDYLEHFKVKSLAVVEPLNPFLIIFIV